MCTLPNCTAALTLSAADAEWSGSAYTGASTNVADFNSSTGLSAAAAVTYEGVDGTTYASSETAPTAVGSYKAVVAVTGLDEAYTLEQTFAITVADGETVLEEDTDYTVPVTPEPQVEAGTYTVTVTGKGNYDPATTAAQTYTIDGSSISGTSKR